jgi:hypothetical protein
MDLKAALGIVRDLADGLDPFTGEPFPEISPYQHPHVVRALYTVLRQLDPPAALPKGRDGRLRSAGLPWTPAEDERLLKEFDSGSSVAEIAERHGRTHGAIESRLVKRGKLEHRNAQKP